MPTSRRVLLANALSAAFAARAFATPSDDSFPSFLSDLRAEARRAGISPTTLDHAFAGVAPNQKVLERDRHQPEFTMTWARYRTLVITDKRITDGLNAVAANRTLFQRVEQDTASARVSSPESGGWNRASAPVPGISASSRPWRPWPGKGGGPSSSVAS